MKNILIVYFLIVSVFGYSQQIDTLYFDSDWEKVADKSFADNYVVTLTSEDANIMARAFRIVDNSPILRGTYKSIDKNNFSRSIKNGKCVVYHKNGNKSAERNFVDDKMEGEQYEYDENGKLRLAGIFEDNQPTYLESYYDGEKLMNVISLKDGEMNGPFKQYYEDGTLAVEKEYIKGKENGIVKQYYENGVLAIEKEYKDGIENGISKQYDESGNLVFSATMVNGLNDGDMVYYQNGNPIYLKSYKMGLPVGMSEDRRGGQVSKTLYKESENNLSSKLRLSCSAFVGSVAVKETGALWNLLSEVPMPTGEKYKSFLCFNIFMQNDLNENVNAVIDNVKVEYLYKKKVSDNLAYSEEEAIQLFEISAKHTANKAYSDASYVARSAATQVTQSSSSSSSYNSTKVSGQSETNSSSSSSSAAIASAISGLFGVDNSGNSAAAVGASVAGASSKTASSSRAKTTASANVSQSHGEYNTNTTTHKDGYLEYQIYNTESEKAAQKASESSDQLIERVSLAKYSHTMLQPNQLQEKLILADTEKKFDKVILYFTLNDVPYEIEFTSLEVLN